MGRKGKKGRRRPSGGKGLGGSYVNMGGQTVHIPFRVTFNLQSEGGGFNDTVLNLHPVTLGDVAANVSTNFTWYRIRRLKIRFCPGTMATNSESYQFAAAFDSIASTDTTSGPGGLNQMSQFPSFQMSNGSPINMTIPRNQLLRVANKWFRCTSTGNPPVDEYYQGAVWIASLFTVASSVLLTHVCLLEGELEFRSIIEAGDRVAKVPRSIPDVKSEDPIDDIPTQVVSAFRDLNLKQPNDGSNSPEAYVQVVKPQTRIQSAKTLNYLQSVKTLNYRPLVDHSRVVVALPRATETASDCF